MPAAKVVDALSSIGGVKEAVLADFSSTLLKAIGGSIGKGESVTLAWTGDDKLVLQVCRGLLVGCVCWGEGARAWRGLYARLTWALCVMGAHLCKPLRRYHSTVPCSF